MLYLNQNDYSDVKYPTHTEEKNHPSHKNTVVEAGCGLCAACMAVDRLSLEPFTLTECRDLSASTKANHASGTDMQILGPAVAEKFDLDYQETNNIEEVIKCLQEGGAVVILTGGDYPGHTGIFTHGGHFITAISYADGEFCILDPSLKKGKFDEKGRKGKVRVEGKFVYASTEVIAMEAANRDPGYYLFRRKSGRASEK